MPIFLMIIGLLLILFGGGCTVIFVGTGAESEFLLLWLVLGLAPSVGGLFLFHYGLEFLREGRVQPPNGGKP